MKINTVTLACTGIINDFLLHARARILHARYSEHFEEDEPPRRRITLFIEDEDDGPSEITDVVILNEGEEIPDGFKFAVSTENDVMEQGPYFVYIRPTGECR